jgi:PQQ-dependent catabolism-associated CXXCW motif protein
MKCAVTFALRSAAVSLALAIGAAIVAGAQPALGQNSFGEATRPAVPPGQQRPVAAPAPAEPGGVQRQVPAGGFSPNAPAAAPSSGAAVSDRLAQFERQDLGVQPTAQLHSGAMHGPTPASIPGGQVITTQGLSELLRGGRVPALTLDVLGGPETIEGAVYAVAASQPGSFDDVIQQQLGQFLAQATGGNKEFPIVAYCLSRECWMSYNAALRAINLGYTNVLWYRGGIEAWKQAGMPVQSSGAR